MRRDRRRQEMQQPTKTTAEAPPTQTLPRTLPEMDAPPIRKAITKEQADAAQRDLEKKLLSVTKQPELTLPELPTEVEQAAPTKSQETSAPKLPQAPPSDDLAAARDELHRLAKPIPVADPSLELAAEELKQLAESEELQDAAASATTPPPTKPGLNFARDAVSTKGIEKPSPIQRSPVKSRQNRSLLPSMPPSDQLAPGQPRQPSFTGEGRFSRARAGQKGSEGRYLAGRDKGQQAGPQRADSQTNPPRRLHQARPDHQTSCPECHPDQHRQQHDAYCRAETQEQHPQAPERTTLLRRFQHNARSDKHRDQDRRFR